MIRNRYKVEPTSSSSLKCYKNRTRHLIPILAFAGTITVRGMHVQIAAIPSGAGTKRRFCESFYSSFSRRLKVDLGLVRGHTLRANVGYADPQLPCARQHHSRKIRRRSVSRADRERTLVASTPSTKALRILNAEVQGGALFFPCVVKRNREPRRIRGNIERNFDVRVVLFALHCAMQDEVRLLR